MPWAAVSIKHFVLLVDDTLHRLGLEVRESSIPGAGRGLFATAPFAAGTVIAHYTGTVLRSAEAVKLKDKSYLMRLGPQCYIDSSDEAAHGHVLARYINDARNPARTNVVFDKKPDELRALVVATRDIAAEEELFVDYGRWYWLKAPGAVLA